MSYNHVGNPGKSGNRIAVRDASETPLVNKAAAGTDFYTDPIALRGAQKVGLFVDVDSSTGTNPTLDISLEISFDKGTTWVEMPATANSQTQAAMTQIDTTIGEYFEWYEVCGDPEFTQIRALFDFGGTSPVYDFGNCWWILDRYPGS